MRYLLHEHVRNVDLKLVVDKRGNCPWHSTVAISDLVRDEITRPVNAPARSPLLTQVWQVPYSR